MPRPRQKLRRTRSGRVYVPDTPPPKYTGELLTEEFDEEITDSDSFLSMVGAASKRRPASE